MVWTVPRTWVTGEIVTAAHLNTHVRDNLNALRDNGTFASRPAAGNVGLEYYASDMGALFFDDGTRWNIVSHMPRLCERLGPEDFVAGAPVSWHPEISGSGTVDDVVGGASQGLIELSTGATNGSQAAFRAKDGNQGHYALQSGRFPGIYETYIKTDVTTNARWRFGLYPVGFPAIAADPTDGIYFKRLDTASAGNWFTVTRASSSGTETDTTVAGTTSFTHFKFEIESTTSIKYYINDTLRGTHTTNIPTLTLNLFYLVENTAAADKNLQVDYVDWLVKRA